MADRAKRIDALIEKNIAEILMKELRNPRLGFVTVNEVQVNADHSLAKVYVSFLGSEHPLFNLKELRNAKGVVRSSLAKKMDLYKVPDLLFLLDEKPQELSSLDEALAKEEKSLKELKNLND